MSGYLGILILFGRLQDEVLERWDALLSDYCTGDKWDHGQNRRDFEGGTKRICHKSESFLSFFLGTESKTAF